MPRAERFNQTLQEWVDVFMHRSMQEFTRWMNDCGLSKSQIGALMRLYYHGTCPVSGIGDDLGITPPAASQLVDRLVHMRLIDRTEDPGDRRIKQVSLSDTGRSLVQQGVDARREWMTDLATRINPAEQAEIESALGILINAVQQMEAEELTPSFETASPLPK
jgi:DNA-binding MarR family transcriptional regulator